MAVSSVDDLTGPQKAALMMLAMGDERAARMFMLRSARSPSTWSTSAPWMPR